MHKVVYFADEKGRTPVLDWLVGLPDKVQDKGFALIEHLEEFGHKMRRPMADNLGGGIWELRWSWQRVNYRILYFFHRREIIVLAHGLTKESKIPDRDFTLACLRRDLFVNNPEKHTYKEAE